MIAQGFLFSAETTLVPHIGAGSWVMQLALIRSGRHLS
jgi:hypothetical protein